MEQYLLKLRGLMVKLQGWFITAGSVWRVSKVLTLVLTGYCFPELWPWWTKSKPFLVAIELKLDLPDGEMGNNW